MIRRKCIAILLGTLMLPGLAGCGPQANTAPGGVSTSRAPLPQPSTQNTALSGTPMQPPFADDASESAKLARQDLAHRLGLPVESVTVSATIGQEFTSDAFYCRKTKERIANTEAPAAMTGFSILLQASGRRYEYHASGGTVVFCRPLS